MKNSKTLFYDFVNKLTLPDDKEELLSIGFLVFENLFGLSKTEIMSDKPVTVDQTERLSTIAARLNDHEPVQYILGEAWFFGRKFNVTPAVLIPRPETEELVQYVINYSKRSASKQLRILDIGTGSGCIAITLSLKVPAASIVATDVSAEALNVARQNDHLNGTSVEFIQHDVIHEELATGFDVIVSNPPYISNEERGSMKSNVLKFEPHLALFVSGNDPLLFYRTIAQRSRKALKENGMLCTEINAQFGKEISEIFADAGFGKISVIRDLQGKERIVSGILNS